MGTLFTALGAAAALAGADIIPVHQGGARAVGLTGAQLLTYVGGSYVAKAGGTMTGALTIASGNLTVSAGYVSATSCIANTGNLGLNSASGFIYWEASGNTRLYQDAAATLAQRNGTTQQIFRLYNSYTDASNYERLTLTGVAGASVNITAETLGTGGDNLNIVLTPAGTGALIVNARIGPTANAQLFIDDTSTWAVGKTGVAAVAFKDNGGIQTVSSGKFGFASGGYANGAIDSAFHRGAAGQVDVTNGTAATYRDLKLRNLLNTEYHQMTEMTAPSAPATNSVRIYAEDNGAGKTRLMALFATGAAVQLGIEP